MQTKASAQGQLLAAMLVTPSACTSLQVAEIDPEPGCLPCGDTADVVKSESVDLDPWRPLLLATGGIS